MDQELIKKARQANLVEYLRLAGYELKREGQRANYRVQGYDALIVQGNHYKDFYSGAGGNSLDFLVKVLGKNFHQAVRELTSMPAVSVQYVISSSSKNNGFVLPPRAGDNRRVIAYLNKSRGLPGDLIVSLIRSKLLYQDQYGNCVFPCLDSNGQAKGAILNGTLSFHRWKGLAPESDTSYGWWWPSPGPSNTVIVTENPIDAISLYVLNPSTRAFHHLSLGGLHLEALLGFISRISVRHIIISVDDDQPGRAAIIKWYPQLEKYSVIVSLPYTKKDWNAVLMANIPCVINEDPVANPNSFFSVPPHLLR